MSAVMEFFIRNMGTIGLILISPALYRLSYSLTLWIYAKLWDNKKNIVIKHYHNGKLVSETFIKSDLNQPLFIKKSNPEVKDE